MSSAAEPEVFIFNDAQAWRAWLNEHEESHDGIWLMLAKKGVTSPTSLTYSEALEEALCSGWIDGQRRKYDDETYLQRFTPRRARSIWSKRNVGLVLRLREQDRMRSRGEREVAQAQSDGRWDGAYDGSAAAVVPEDLLAALEAAGLQRRFASLSAQRRYALLHPLMTAPNPAVRVARLQRIVDRLSSDSATGG